MIQRRFRKEDPEEQAAQPQGIDPRSFGRVDPSLVQDMVGEFAHRPLQPGSSMAAVMLRQTDRILARSIPGFRGR
jgi:hypothetical protein